jgi:hypothetical protein
MAWASVGVAGSTGNITANSSAMSIGLRSQPGSGANVGDLLVFTIAVDNASSDSNVDEVAVLSVTDGASNAWVKAREITAGGAAVQAGAVCSVWYSHITNALTTSHGVGCIFGSTATRDFKCGQVWRFSKSPTASVRMVDSTYVTIATSSCGTLDIATNSGGEFLRFRAIAAETTNVTAMTTTAGWVTMGTTRAGSNSAMSVKGEFLIASGSTAASSPSIAAAVDQASIYAVFEECELMGDGIL